MGREGESPVLSITLLVAAVAGGEDTSSLDATVVAGVAAVAVVVGAGGTVVDVVDMLDITQA